MSLEGLHNLERRLLQLLIIVLPLNGIPESVRIPGLVGDLVNYVYCLMIIALVYEYLKYRFSISQKALLFIIVFILWQIICLIIGLINYEYNDLLILEQTGKLKTLLIYLSKFGVEINELVAIKGWLFLRFIKNILLLNNIVFFVTFYIYHLYENNFIKAFNDVRKAVIILVLVMGTYSFIELLWLKLDLDFARRFLEFINPYLYDVKTTTGWWPPLLWKNQLRSICQEPSFFGIISIFCIPFLWSLLSKNKYKVISCFLLFYFTLMIAATNARTAIFLLCAEIILLGIFVLIRKEKIIFKNFVIVLCVSVLAFGTNLINFKQMIENISSPNTNVSTQLLNKDNKEKIISKKTKVLNTITMNSAKNYLQHNVVNITDVKARSNGARLASLLANLETIKQHPLFGVGSGLKDAYIDSNISKFANKNSEVKNWGRYMHNKGVLKAGYPVLNKYTDIAVQNGLFGLLLYFLPLLYIIKLLYKNRSLILKDYNSVMLMIIMIACLGAMMSNSALVICNGIVWGLLLCKIKQIEK